MSLSNYEDFFIVTFKVKIWRKLLSKTLLPYLLGKCFHIECLGNLEELVKKLLKLECFSFTSVVIKADLSEIKV